MTKTLKTLKSFKSDLNKKTTTASNLYGQNNGINAYTIILVQQTSLSPNGICVENGGIEVALTATPCNQAFLNPSSAWTFFYNSDGSYIISSSNTGGYLWDDSNASLSAGNMLRTWTPNGSQWQNWYVLNNPDGTLSFQNQGSQMCFSYNSGGSYAFVQNPCGGANQNFILFGSFFFPPPQSAGVGNYSMDQCVQTEGSEVALGWGACTSPTIWNFTQLNNGAYQISNSTGFWDDSFASTSPGNMIRTWPSNQSIWQEWFMIYPSQPGQQNTVNFKNSGSGMCLDVGTNGQTPLVINACNGSQSQLFFLVDSIFPYN